MVNTYDNWERLVRRTLDREKLKQLARCRSLSSGSSSSTSSSFDDGSNYMIVEFVHGLNDELQSCSISLSTELLRDINQTGRKKISIGAKKLTISCGENPMNWNWTSHPDSRFSEVAELKSVCSLDIKCKIGTHMLSRKTRYGAYLVFKLAEENYGFGSVNGVVRFLEYEQEVGAERRTGVLFLDQAAARTEDGWMEIELGEFLNDEGEDGEIEARMMETCGHWKSGIIVEAIEFRPKKSYHRVEQFQQRSGGAYDHKGASPGAFRKIPYRADLRFSQVDFLKLVNAIQTVRLQNFEGDGNIAMASQFIQLMKRDRLTANKSLVPRQSSQQRLWSGCWKSAGLSIQFRPGTSHDRTLQTGQKSLIIGARELMISWGDNPDYWNWISHPDSRFSEVAHLKSVCWLDIKCKIDTQMLSPKTTYGAYFVFKLAGANNGLELVNGVVRFVEHEAETDAEKRARPLHLVQLALSREDGWMEIELGDFSNDKGDDGEVEARLMEFRQGNWKSGIIVKAIEFRRKTW